MGLGDLAIILALCAFGFVIAWFGWKRWSHISDRPDLPYRVFTTEFDIECGSQDVAGVLQTSGNNIAASQSLQNRSLVDLKPSFEQAISFWSAKLLSRPTTRLEGKSYLVLVDQSGSMADRVAQFAGELFAAIDWMEKMGASVMLAGFTTVGWHGGKSRKAWQKAGRPEYPGRLCDLFYIKYSGFDEVTTPSNVAELLKSRAFFENVDGEALLWARTQLENASGDRVIIALSDGAPVDDSTLLANGNEILWRHFKSVVQEIESDPKLKLGAIGLDHRVDEVYRQARVLADGESLAPVMLDMAEVLAS